MNKTSIFLIIFLLITLFFGIQNVFALQTDPESSIELVNPLGSDTNTISDVLSRIIDGLQTVATPIAGIMVLISGFQILFAGGDPEKFKKGKKVLLYTVIGYTIILVANGIDDLIVDILTSE